MTKELSPGEFMMVCKRRGKRVSFVMPVEFEQLLFNRGGVETLNVMVDMFVKDGYLLEDISFTPLKVESDHVHVEVDAYAKKWYESVGIFP